MAGATSTVGRLRLPRAALAVLVGLCSGLGGVNFQTMLRNPLASPDIIGITAGAGAAAALGVRVERTRLIVIVTAVGLIAFATAAAGPIAFVAFLSGPFAARVVGPGASLLVPSALVGALLVLVADLVGRGRHPRQGILSRWNTGDDDAVVAALDATAALAERPVDEFSGGQRQRVWIAMALAQQTDLLLLDEPTTFLDVSHQIEVLDLLTDLNHTRGTTIVMVLHDLDLAARYTDHLIALSAGRLHAAGHPHDVLAEDTVQAVFGLESRIITDPTSGRPLVLPVGRHCRTASALAGTATP